MSQFPHRVALFKGAVYVGFIWAIGYGSWIMVSKKMEQNQLELKESTPPEVLQMRKEQNQRFLQHLMRNRAGGDGTHK